MDRWLTFSKTEDITAVHVKVKKQLLQDLLCRVDGFLRGAHSVFCTRSLGGLTVIICRLSEE